MTQQFMIRRDFKNPQALTQSRQKMQIFLGPFHPQLEDRLIEEIQRFKLSDPLRPLLIVVPSDSLRHYLIKQFTLIHRLNLIQVSFLNFNQLSNTLYAEMHTADVNLQDDLFFEEILYGVIRKTNLDFSKLCNSEGGISALWQCLRDLKEGLFQPDIGTQALTEGHFGKAALRGKLPHLFSLYHKLEETCRSHQIFDYGEIARHAKETVADSVFLKSFDTVFYYGFYDLTQVLIDLIHEISKYRPTTLFFPLVRKAPGWVFSERFFERYIAGIATNITDLTKKTHLNTLSPHTTLFSETRPEVQPPDKIDEKSACTIISCYNTRDEVLTVAKEILRLNDKGVAFSKIGVAAREIEPYLSVINDIFPKHAIPVTSRCETAMMPYPLALSIFLMTTLLVEDFPRAPCIDVITSPFFRPVVFCKAEAVASEHESSLRGEWDLLTREAKITKGWASWRQLKTPDQEALSDSDRHTALLWAVFSELYRDLNGLPKKETWPNYAERWHSLLTKYFGLMKTEEESEPAAEADFQERNIQAALRKNLDRLASFGGIAGPISREDFIAAFQRGLKRTLIPFSAHNTAGTSVMNIMQARGLSFPYVFLLGMNEGGFPRTIREDPFLQDHHRRVMETVLGYKVGEKLAGYDEEKLLFTLAIGSAKRTCYALYHRTDASGNPCAPSWYLKELKRAYAIDAEQCIPRGLLERESLAPFDKTKNLLSSEWAIRLHLNGQDMHPLLKQLPFSSELYLQGKMALSRLEATGALTSHDGLIHEPTTDWKRLLKQGISPTRLEAYARCPFQYYARHLLKLAPAEDPEDETEPATSDIGTLCHQILKVFYEGMQTEGGFSPILKSNALEQDLNTLAEPLFVTYELENPVRYPLHWETLKAQIRMMLYEVLKKDQEALSKSGYHPAAFEVECRQKIEADWPEFSGKIDRIDFNLEEGTVRAIDYKVTFRKSPKPLERNLLTSALRGERLQAPIYLRLAEIFAEARHGASAGGEGTETAESPCASFFYHLAPNWPDGPLIVSEFPETGWREESGVMLRETISTLLQGIESGRFFMKPGDHCTFCDVQPLCRKNHVPSLKRIEADSVWQRHQSLQEKTPPKNFSKEKRGKSR